MLETFKNDGKVFHHNAGFSYLGSILENLMIENRQCDIITTCGICTAMVSKKGKVHISNNITYGITSEKSKISEHNRAKNHLLSPEAPFLYPLGITDRNGRILDKRRSKYKQINRFLEMVDDVYNELPKNGDLTVCDLCCGKSILAFAVYWYLSEYRKREIRMYGVDLKEDVINLETEIAVRLNYRGMHFICEDVEKFVPPVSHFPTEDFFCGGRSSVGRKNFVEEKKQHSRIAPRDRELFRSQLAQLDMGLEERMRQPVGLLSGGQRQALTLLMATMVPPQLLLLDEHTAALDPGTAEKVLTLTKRIVAEGNITCLMVTHNMSQALELGTRTLMMADGGIVLDVSGPERAGMTVEDLIARFKAGTTRWTTTGCCFPDREYGAVQTLSYNRSVSLSGDAPVCFLN